MNTGEKNNALSSVWINSDPTSKYGAVFDKNMDESSFHSLDESLIKTINLPNNAFFGSMHKIQAMACKVTTKSTYRTHSAINKREKNIP